MMLVKRRLSDVEFEVVMMEKRMQTRAEIFQKLLHEQEGLLDEISVSLEFVEEQDRQSTMPLRHAVERLMRGTEEMQKLLTQVVEAPIITLECTDVSSPPTRRTA